MQNADLAQARREANHHGDSSSEKLLEQAVWLDALASLEDAAGHPHGARRAREQLDALCQTWRNSQYSGLTDKNRGRASALCALATAAFMEQPRPWSSHNALAGDLMVFQTSALDEPERLYLTGRLRSALSPIGGQDFKTALVSWRILERLAPQTPSKDYWLGVTLLRQGNAALGEQSLEQALALTPADPRAVLRAQRQDGYAPDPTYGWMPYVFSSPVVGFGGGVRIWDERLGDGPRGLAVEASASTVGTVQGALQYRELGLLQPFSLHAEVSGGRVYWGYASSQMTSGVGTTLFAVNRVEAAVGIDIPLVKRLSLSVDGLLWVFSPTALPAGLSASEFNGIAHTLSWNLRPSWTGLRRGVEASWRQEWLWGKSGAPIGRSRVQASYTFAPAIYHEVSLNAAMGAAPDAGSTLNAFFDLASLGTPGVQQFRYQSLFAASSWLRYRYRVLSWLRLGGFGAVGAAESNLTRVVNELRWGTGAEVELILGSARWVPRWEIAVFNSELVFQGGWRAQF